MMVWDIKYLLDKKVILIKTKGDISYQDLPRQFEEAICLAKASETNCFLFDDTELHINASTLDIYELPKLILSAGISRASKIAVVISPEETRVDNFKFLETVSVNQGLSLKVFLSLKDGYEWLLK